MDSFEYFGWIPLSQQKYIRNSRLVVSENVEIINSRFYLILQGSAISVVNKEIYFILSRSSFDGCSGSNIGSAINLSIIGKGCVSINRVCGTNCNATDYCMFGIITLDADSKGTTDVKLVSISQCSSSSSYHELFLNNGMHEVSNINVSSCTLNRYSFVSSSTFAISHYSYCNAAECQLTNQRIHHVYSCAPIEYSNYVNNKRNNVESSSRGLMYMTGESAKYLKQCSVTQIFLF